MAAGTTQRLTALVSAFALVAAALAASTAGAAALGPARSAGAEIRVNQQGYLRHEPKVARLMVPHAVSGARYIAKDAAGRVVLRGLVPTQSSGSWNRRFRAVYPLDVSPVHSPGRYRILVRGPVHARSPWFRVSGPGRLFGTMLDAGVSFDQVQRDGHAVIPGALGRVPAHLLDAHATVYDWPRMAAGSDLIIDRRLHPIGGPVDVEGGWYDAGDYLKFTHSSAYNDILLFTSARLLGRRAPRALLAEARHGLRWLDKMWDARHQTLYFQVGVGSGNRAGTFLGDHDLWRLPEADDQDTTHSHRFVAHRPVFRAATPGHDISPNLVGRVTAAFALAAQADAGHHRARARRELHQAELLYATAATTHPPRPLVTALPHAFYPESSWQDDMALGAAEIALAADRLGARSGRYLRDAGHWLRGHHRSTGTDTLNLYDVGALADVAVARALRTVDHRGRLAVTRGAVVADLRDQIRRGLDHAAHDPFAAAEPVDEFDADSHTFGLIATVALYDQLTHTHRYARFASAQRAWLLGGNPWGVGTMVGVGDSFPLCMQHQIANLSGTRNGRRPLDLGAVVNGPNGADNFEGGLGGFQTGMVHCAKTKARGLRRFDGHGGRFVDDVRAWQTDEPALDMTGAAIIAAAAQLRLHPGARLRSLREEGR
jgi:endoglucanase